MNNNDINLSVSDFSNSILNDELAVIIDVRTPSEFSDGHIPNSILVDIYDPTFQEKISALDKSKNYYVYCRSGNRSLNASAFMISQGFSKVCHLKDGIISWTDKLEK